MPSAIPWLAALYFTVALPDPKTACEVALCPRNPVVTAPTKSDAEVQAAKLRQMLFLPVGFSCPTTPGEGVLEQTKFNLNGDAYRGRVYYRGNQAERITLEIGRRITPLEMYKDLTWAELTSPEEAEYFKHVVDNWEPIKANVCEGGAEARAAFQKLVDLNRAALESGLLE